MSDSPSKIYTRTGDGGSTGLMERKRVHKDSPRIQAIGEVDELNCQMGLIGSLRLDDQMKGFLQEIQNMLFEMGAELAQPVSTRLISAHTARLEQFIDRLNESLPPLQNFILPGGCHAAAQCHLARAVCRRAERSLFRLSRSEHVNPASLQFLNRLSDLLFMIARTMNQRQGTEETLWKDNTRKDKA